MTVETVTACLEQAMFWFGTVVAAASIIVKATPSQKDDAFLAKVVKVMDFVSIVNAEIQDRDKKDNAG